MLFYKCYRESITVITQYVTRKEVSILFSIDHMSRKPIYEQIIEEAESFILAGVLKAGDKLPSVRSLSVSLSVTPVTILKALGELDARSLITSVPGKGYFVCDGAKETLAQRKLTLLDDIEALARELAMARVPMEEALRRISTAYGEDGSDK